MKNDRRATTQQLEITHLYASRGFVLRRTENAMFEVQLIVGSSVDKIPACV